MTINNRVEKMFKDVTNMRNNYMAKEIQRDAVLSTVQGYEQDIEKLNRAEVNYGKAAEAFKKIADTRNEEAKAVLEDVLNWALDNIDLEQRYSARLDERDSGRSGKEMVIVLVDKDTGNERTLRNQTGTAISQIVSFLMNIIVIKFSGATRIMVLDEVFSGLSDIETVRMFGEILVALAENEDFQFIMVEHEKELREVEGINKIQLAIKKYEDGLVVVK